MPTSPSQPNPTPGTHHGTERIICDGATITVTKNCVAALRNVRDDRACRHQRLWVDAICINRGEDEAVTVERSQQIGIMGEIYTKASQVHVWLGKHDRSSQVVCEFLDKVSGAYKRRVRRTPGDMEQVLRVAESLGLDIARRWPQLSQSIVNSSYRSWFHRAWSVQEVTLPLPGG
ncbi:hypothetical protein N657DRAFT_53161 [Parathielavia appendiculata]|uniref:Heterokaryon incompatibility domain-containing protein n=1 Tax=Parathielavia appendiculata TaxID=2587402 RepID=A0AAN6U9T8_9PEZI|nr:hypothetical protein N657DRAFT_53161 [Parathielavia appendiculata]